MSEAVVDDIVAVLPPLLQSLEALGFITRHLNPPDFGSVMEAAGEPDAALRGKQQAALLFWLLVVLPFSLPLVALLLSTVPIHGKALPQKLSPV